MRAPVSVVAVALALAGAACHKRHVAPAAATPAPKPAFTASRVRAFSDSLAVTAIADSPTTLYVGTARGLIRWDGGRSTVMTQKDGLPADRVAGLAVDGAGGVWLATDKGLTLGKRNVWSNFAPAPVGNFLTGLVADGKTVWTGGPEGLGRLRAGKWDHYFADTAVTALAAGAGNIVWVGTNGAGVLRIAGGGEKLDRFGAAQGCETEVVRGLVAVDKTLLVVGEGPDGARAAFFDGQRFYSYKLSAPTVIEWAARAGARTLLGSGDHIYSVAEQKPPAPGEAAPAESVVKLTPIAGYVLSPRSIALKPDLPSTVLDEPPGTVAPRPPTPRKGEPALSVPQGPPLVAEEFPIRLPDGVTAVAGSERGLLVGTRFLGAERIENDVPRLFRVDDLVAGATRLTVACTAAKGDDCFLATGSTRAFRYDGQAFEIAPVDPEPGSRVLAVLRDPTGAVLAIHRGAPDNSDRSLRISRVDDGRWTPVATQAVEVPSGAPEINFAEFGPDGHLWVGLRYVDSDGDARDWGAHEIALDTGKVIAHKELPTDAVAMFWKAKNEAWFATRSGAARLLDGKVRVFTENDGMESEITRDIAWGRDGIYVATGRGTGRFDGARWIFPRLGAFYHPANALARDSHGDVFVGTDKGLFCVGECAPEAIDRKRGLLDDTVQDLAVDAHDRVWVLTQKGINIVDP